MFLYVNVACACICVCVYTQRTFIPLSSGERTRYTGGGGGSVLLTGGENLVNRRGWPAVHDG